MNENLKSALSNAMSRLKIADVTGATAAIQRAMTGQPTSVQRPRRADGVQGVGMNGHRRLGDVLRTLKAMTGHDRTPLNPEGPDATVQTDPRFQARHFRTAAGSCSYKLYVPAERPDRPQALIVMLHGCTQNPDDFARGTQMNRLAEEFGLIVAYPHQPRSANAQGCWNWFDVRHQGQDGGEPAVLAELARSLASEFSIGRDRVFVAGLSAGGAMADILSTTHPHVFAAVGVHSGLPHGAAHDVMTAFAAMKGNGKPNYARKAQAGSRKIVFHGTGDATVHPSNGRRAFDNSRSDRDSQQEIRSDTKINGIRVDRTLLCPANGRTTAELWEIHGAGHAWSGGDRSGTFTDPKGPDASREMIRFFLET